MKLRSSPKAFAPQLAVTYARVSTDEQAEHGTSLADQKEQTRAHAESLGYIVASHCADEGISGTVYETRKGLQDALAMLEAGDVSLLVATKPDRIGRTVLIQENVKLRVKRAGAGLAFVSFKYEETPEGALQFGVIAQFSAYEHAMIAARVTAGKRKRARDGIQTCTKPPYGYHIPLRDEVIQGKYPSELQGKYVIVEEQARAVRRAFELVAAGQSLRSVVGIFNREGIRSQRDCLWSPANLHRTLHNPVYKGEARFGFTRYWQDEGRLSEGYMSARRDEPSPEEKRITIPCPALVSPALFDQVQDILARNQKYGSGNPERKKLLTGLLRCGLCGGALRFDGGSTFRIPPHPGTYRRGTYYRCSRAHRKPEQGEVCAFQSLNAGKLEAAVVSELLSFLDQPALITEALERQHQREVEQGSADNETALRKQLEGLTHEERTAIVAQMRGIAVGADSSIYEEYLAEISLRRASVQERLTAIDAHRQRQTAYHETGGRLAQSLADVHLVLTSPDVETAERRAALTLLLDRVVVHSLTRMELHFRL